MKKLLHCRFTIAYLLLAGFLTGCSQTIPDTPVPSQTASSSPEITPGRTGDSSGNTATYSTILDDPSEEVPGVASIPGGNSVGAAGLRDNSPVCLIPTADGTAENHNDAASIDYSNASCGYVMVSYTGTCPKVKLRITGPDKIIYTYDLNEGGYETFPLSSGNGSYDVTVYENISGTSYTTCLFSQVSVQLENELTPFLYPNQYVNFRSDSKTVAKGAELAEDATSELEVVVNIYNYIIHSIDYDYQKASDPPTGYTTDVDEILESGTGICLDYAAVMAAMLRSQKIPTRLEVGYAKDAYHAWISVYIQDVGWLNGIIEFDGKDWTLVDPTFGANTDDKTLKKFIGDGSNYILQKIY